MTANNSQSREQLRILEEAGLLSDELGLAIQQSFRYGCQQSFEQQQLEKRIADFEDEQARCPFFQPRKLNHGNFILGYVPNTDIPIRIPVEWMGAPGLIAGSTGSGKTTTSRFWSSQLFMLCDGAWFIDCRKSEGRCIAEFVHEAGHSCSIVETHQFKCNPLEVPPHVSPPSYAANVADALVRVMVLPPTARKVLQQAIYFLYSKHGILDGSNKTNYPTMFELYNFVAQSKNFHAQAREALLTALAPLLMSLRSVLAYRKGWNICDLAKHKIIFEFNSASEAGKNLLTNCGLILPTFEDRVSLGFSNVDPDLFIYFDEGSSLIESDDATISRWIGLVRGVGLALLISNQSAVAISQKCLSNFPNRFTAQLSSHADLNVMAASCGLDGNQKKYLAQALKPGLLCGSLAQGNWRHPFLFTTPLMKSGNEKYEGNGCAELNTLPTVTAPEFENWVPEWMRREVVISNPEPPLLEHTANGATHPTEGLRSENTNGLTPKELLLLNAVVAEPCIRQSALPEKLHLSKLTIQGLRDSLIAKNLIRTERIQTASRGRKAILLAPTENAIAMLTQCATE